MSSRRRRNSRTEACDRLGYHDRRKQSPGPARVPATDIAGSTKSGHRMAPRHPRSRCPVWPGLRDRKARLELLEGQHRIMAVANTRGAEKSPTPTLAIFGLEGGDPAASI